MMGKAIVYTALVIVCLGSGILIGGAIGYYTNFFKQENTPHIRKLEVSCYPKSKEGNVSGEIIFTQTYMKNIQIIGNVTGLSDGNHGFHVHTYGITNNGDCLTAKGHYNPRSGRVHGSPLDLDTRHMGDLGNINVTNGYSDFVINDTQVTLFDEYSVIGRSLVIHEYEDTFNDSSSAGGRIACCTIGIKLPV